MYASLEMTMTEMFDIDNEVFRRQINEFRMRICDRRVDGNAGCQPDLTNTSHGCLGSGMTEILLKNCKLHSYLL